MTSWAIVAEPSPVEAFAASELARYLRLMTGASGTQDGPHRRRIFVGMDAYSRKAAKPRARAMLRGLPPDGFVVRSLPEGLLIAGASSRATLYGAYAWLEALGLRWFFPGRSGEVVPSLRPAQVSLAGWRIRTAPAFAKRGVVLEPGNSALDDWIDFAAKKRLSAVAIHGFDGLDRARSVAMARGLRVEAEVHLLEKGLCSADEERASRYRAALDEALERLPPDMADYFLWQADGDPGTCDCPPDRGLNAAEVTMRVYNRLAEALCEVRPAARLAFLVYLATWQPPDRPITRSPHLFGEFAPIERCMAHGIDDPACSTNRRTITPGLDKWAHILPFDEGQVLDYWLDSSLFGRGRFRAHGGRVPHIGTVIRRDAVSYRRRGFRAVTTFAVGVDREYLARWITPPLFQYPAILWNPETDLDALTEDFAETWLGTADARVGLDALAAADVTGRERARPGGTDERLERARETVAGLMHDSPPPPFCERLERLRAEIAFRAGLTDIHREESAS